MRELLNTLYVQSQGAYLRLEGETVRVEVEREVRATVPLHHLGSIVVFGNVLVSPFLLGRCAEDGRSLVWMSANGRFLGRVEGKMRGSVLLRHAQHLRTADPGAALPIARAIVAGKTQNSRLYLLRSARDAVADEPRNALRAAASRIEAQLRSLPEADSLDEVRGVEGAVAAIYFASFTYILRSGDSTFAWAGRSRRPPLDPINCLLSFLYALVLNDCRSAVEAAGLDPQAGFLHALRPGRPALALDLMEEFRALLADRVAFALINRRQLNETHFVWRTGGAVELTDEGRRIVLVAYQKRKQEEVAHPLAGEPVALGLVPLLQARLLARTIRGELATYAPFIPR